MRTFVRGFFYGAFIGAILVTLVTVFFPSASTRWRYTNSTEKTALFSDPSVAPSVTSQEEKYRNEYNPSEALKQMAIQHGCTPVSMEISSLGGFVDCSDGRKGAVSRDKPDVFVISSLVTPPARTIQHQENR